MKRKKKVMGYEFESGNLRSIVKFHEASVLCSVSEVPKRFNLIPPFLRYSHNQRIV